MMDKKKYATPSGVAYSPKALFIILFLCCSDDLLCNLGRYLFVVTELGSERTTSWVIERKSMAYLNILAMALVP